MIYIFSLLAAGTAFAVYRNLRNIFGLYNHLTDADIHAYQTGQLSEDDRRYVTKHLGVCEQCQQAMINHDPDEHAIESDKE